MWQKSNMLKMSVALLTICLVGPLKVTAYDVPVTFQTLVIFGCASFLNPRQTALTVGLYLFLGAIGLPVFAGYQGGWAKLTGPTAGFLWGFLPVAVGLSWILQHKKPYYIMGVIYFFFAHVILLVPGFIILNYLLAGVENWPTLVRLIPGLVIKSFVGGLLVWSAQKYKVA
jgi:biotin transport system substrate-specific component